jgi:hypothetical protein
MRVQSPLKVCKYIKDIKSENYFRFSCPAGAHIQHSPQFSLPRIFNIIAARHKEGEMPF